MSLSPTTLPSGMPAVPALIAVRQQDRQPGELFVPAVTPDSAADPHAEHEPPAEPSPRPVVVVDVETNGLDPTVHRAVEVAWWNLTTGDHGCFIPPHDIRHVLKVGNLEALRVCRYLDRIAGHLQDDGGEEARRLAAQLDGATLAGANPTFDATFLAQMFSELEDDEATGVWIPEWHYRLWDVEAYAAGVLGLDHVPSLREVCERLDLAPGDHTAAGDVAATGTALSVLQGIADRRAAPSTAEVMAAHVAAGAQGRAR